MSQIERGNNLSFNIEIKPGYFEELDPVKQRMVTDFMLQEWIARYPIADFDNNQTICFAGQNVDDFRQVIPDVRIVLDGYPKITSGQIFTGRSLPGLMSISFLS